MSCYTWEVLSWKEYMSGFLMPESQADWIWIRIHRDNKYLFGILSPRSVAKLFIPLLEFFIPLVNK